MDLFFANWTECKLFLWNSKLSIDELNWIEYIFVKLNLLFENWIYLYCIELNWTKLTTIKRCYKNMALSDIFIQGQNRIELQQWLIVSCSVNIDRSFFWAWHKWCVHSSNYCWEWNEGIRVPGTRRWFNRHHWGKSFADNLAWLCYSLCWLYCNLHEMLM